MDTFTKLLYIGTGLHIEPVLDFPNVKEFIFIDTLPRSQFGDNHGFSNNWYRQHFMSDLKKKFKKHNFKLIHSLVLDNQFEKKYLTISQRFLYGFIKKRPPHINPTLLFFHNYSTKQIIKYYISTNITINKDTILESDLQTSDTLIISGHFPDEKLLEYINKPKKLICYSETCYYCENDDDVEKGNIFYDLKNEMYFSNCFYVDKKKKYEITEYKNFAEMVKFIQFLK